MSTAPKSQPGRGISLTVHQQQSQKLLCDPTWVMDEKLRLTET